MTLLNFNKHPIGYKYYDNCDELVNRLRLLLASQFAGNNAHQNEIVFIIEELREAGVIKLMSGKIVGYYYNCSILTVNKFGNYLYYKTQPDKIQTQPVGGTKDCNTKLYQSVYIVPVPGISREYKFNMNGQIQNVNISSQNGNVLVILNDNDPIPPNQLKSINIKKDDVIRVTRVGHNIPINLVFIEILLFCTIVISDS